MKTIVQALIGWLFGALGGWLQRRKATKDDAAATEQRADALRDSQAQRDQAERAVEASHVQIDDQLDQLHAAADRPDSLRQQSDVAQRAIDAANHRVQ